MRFTVQEYSPIWADQFQAIKGQLEKILDGVSFVSIEHVGSTSVPGLAAKPVIDIDVAVTPANLESAKTALVKQGRYVDQGETGIPDRHVFRKTGESPTRNLYVCIEGSQSLRNHLLVRDLCRRDATIRDAYNRRKLELAQLDWANVDEYTEEKNCILLYILEKAGMEKHDLDDIRQRSNIATVPSLKSNVVG